MNNKNIINIFAVVVVALMTIRATDVQAACTTFPSCESLGYTKTAKQCEGLAKLKCPFGDTYFCTQADQPQGTCSDGGFQDSQPEGSLCIPTLYGDKACFADCKPCGDTGFITCDDGTCISLILGGCCEGQDFTCALYGPDYKCINHRCVLPACKDNEMRCGTKCVDVEGCSCTTHRCSDGTCIPNGECCSDQKKCSSGSLCVSKNSCCDNEQMCNGTCISKYECCNSKKCNGECIPLTACCGGCPSGMTCSNGNCIYAKDCVTPCQHYRSKPTIGVTCYDRCINGCIGSDPAWANGDHTAMGQRCD